MEQNASNALVMAAGMLIGIMLVSLAVFIFSTSAEFAKTYDVNVEQTRLGAFNNQFEIYNREDLTIQDIVTVANLARDINIKNGYEENSSYYIIVKLDGVIGQLEKEDKKDLYDLMSNNTFVNGSSEKIQKYRCKSMEYNENTSRINKIIFEKVKEN